MRAVYAGIVARVVGGFVIGLVTMALLAGAFGLVGAVNFFGPGMEPTVKSGSRLFYHASLGLVRRGDVVLYRGQERGALQLGRVVGMPGESVVIQDGKLAVNGIVIPEPYLSEPTPYNREVKLAFNEYYILGDNRAAAVDSSVQGPITADAIGGIIIER